MAAVININFDSSLGGTGPISGGGHGPIGYTGSTWNNVSVAGGGEGGTRGGTDFSDSQGNATTIDLSIGTTGGYNTTNTNLELLADYLYTKDVSQTFTVSGLEVGASYNLTFIGHGGSTIQGPSITIGGDTQNIEPTDMGATSYTEGENYVTFTVVADSSGEISGSYSPIGTNTFGGISALQISSIPEPSVALLGGLGGLLLLRRRRWA
ncbi:MAG: hypothetical protein R3242_06550 [Akkermansiaceae bacterium]|nr:hypothetical protein [Akkermansiaceae bacterium]